MAANQVNLPPGFVIDQEPNVPQGFQLDRPPAIARGGGIPPSAPGPIADPTDVSVPGGYQSRGRALYGEVQKQLQKGPSEVGAMAGGTLGSIAGPLTIGQIPPLTFLPEEAVTVPLSAAIGAYVGGGAGSATQQAMTPTGVVDWRAANRAGMWEAGSELAGRGLIGGAKALGNVIPTFGLGFKQPVTGPAQAIIPERRATAASRAAYQKTVKELEKRGGVATPAQVDKRWWLHVGEGFARGSWVGSEAFEQAAKKNEALLVEMAKDTVDDMVEGTFRRTPTEAGEGLLGAISRQLPTGGQGTKIQQWHALFDPVYAQVDDLAKGGVVSTSKLKGTATTMLKRDAAAKGRLLEAGTRQDYLGILKMDDDVTLQTMRDMRTRWQGKVRQFSKDMNPDMGRVNDLSRLADDAIMNAATSPKLPPEARSLLKTANKHYARYKNVMEEVFPLRMAERLRTNPERVVTDLFPTPTRKAGGSLRRIQAVQQALTKTPEGAIDPEGTKLFNQLRQAWLAGIVQQNSEKGVLNTGMIRAQLGRYGKESLGILLPKKERKALEAVLNVGEGVRRKGLMSGGALVAKSAQAAGVGYMLYGGSQEGSFVKVLAGGTLVFGPVAWARMATNPVGSRILRAGIPQFRGHRELATTGARLIRLLMAEDAKDDQAAKRLQQRYDRTMRSRVRVGRYPTRPVSGHHF